MPGPMDPTLPRVRDLVLFKTISLPNGAATVTSAAIDLGADRHLAEAEILAQAPALSAALLPDTQTITYTVEFAAASGFGSVLRSVPLGVQTGASSAGAVADEYRTGIESTAPRYVRLKAVKTGAADASAAAASIGIAT